MFYNVFLVKRYFALHYDLTFANFASNTAIIKTFNV